MTEPNTDNPDKLRPSSRGDRHGIATTILEYQGHDEPSPPRVSGGLQFLFGLLLAYAYGVAVAVIDVDAALEYVWAHVLTIIVLALLVRVRLRWKGFVPGVVAAILLSPVGFLIVCGIIVACA